MQRIGLFEKVTFKQFQQAWEKIFVDTTAEIQELYQQIKLPCRATNGSAGYDFFTPIAITLKPQENILLPTGVRVKIEQGWFLGIVPKSGLGFKYRLQMDNTMGIIDSDYYYSDNEGHIFVKMTNDNRNEKVLEIKAGDPICQGIFLPFGITYDDNVTAIRNGGFGSTSK
ncbi:MAG: deoxyuridine 5'-triphosphate nucleotidohydrolase [Alphaproteobacteria bacterium]|nr:deoxyuridine 5'-triphosphate nucleotidohydrolase [Alphaproteobacteria bacterium]